MSLERSVLIVLDKANVIPYLLVGRGACKTLIL